MDLSTGGLPIVAANVTLAGGMQAADVDLAQAGQPATQSGIAAKAPSRTAWFMILLGFGVLGTLSRRGTQHPPHEQ